MKSKKKFVLAGLVLLAITGLLALAGCKNDTVPETPATELVSITVTPPTKTVYSVGDTFDSTGMTVTATYDDGEEREVSGWTTDFTTVAAEKGLAKTVTVSYKEGEVEKTDTFTVTVFPADVKVLSGYTSPNHTGSEWTYVEFGEWPQSEASGVNPTLVAPQPENLFKDKYYSDANGEYVKEGDKYYKVEPIVWRVLTENYNSTGKALLLAESILTGGIPYYVEPSQRTIGGQTVYANNYKYSTVRAWLNGSYEADDKQTKTYTNSGFLQTAFTESARALIAETTVDNSKESTNPDGNATLWNSGNNDYVCADTTDKVFLLSEKEATTTSYGFAAYNQSGEGSTRIRAVTDYAEATGAYKDSSGGWWWLRSPFCDYDRTARCVNNDGFADDSLNVSHTGGGVVPALSISLQGN